MAPVSGSVGSSNNNKRPDSRSLLTIVLDVSPCAWGERDLRRAANDKARLAQKKQSAGPATLEEVLRSVQAFCTSFGSLERVSGLLIVAVADNEASCVFPRKDHLARFFANPETNPCYDLRTIRADLVEGVSELVSRAVNKRNAHQNTTATTTTTTASEMSSTEAAEAPPTSSSAASTTLPPGASAAAMASAFSLALCLINRFLVATQTGVGVSAVRSEHFVRPDDGGVLAMIGGGDHDTESKKKNKKANAWSPRILLVQASDDRSRDYNAFMNCAFSAVKHNIVVDGCFIPSGRGGASTSSPFLEQACDLTGGVFLAPSGLAQVGGALTEVLMSVFLAPRFIRSSLNLPATNKVDFRARCFETGESVDTAFVCNQCLSIFKKKPKEHCPTCQADIKLPSTSNTNKKQRTDIN